MVETGGKTYSSIEGPQGFCSATWRVFASPYYHYLQKVLMTSIVLIGQQT
jgi:hypothetical protein